MKRSHIVVGAIALVVGYALGHWSKERTYTEGFISGAKSLSRELNDKALQEEREKAYLEALTAFDQEMKRLESLSVPPQPQSEPRP